MRRAVDVERGQPAAHPLPVLARAEVGLPPFELEGATVVVALDDEEDGLSELKGPADLTVAAGAREARVGEEEYEDVGGLHAAPGRLLGHVGLVRA